MEPSPSKPVGGRGTTAKSDLDHRHGEITAGIGKVYEEEKGEAFAFNKQFLRVLKDFLAGWKGSADDFLKRYRAALRLSADQYVKECRKASDPIYLCKNWQPVGAEIASFQKPRQNGARRSGGPSSGPTPVDPHFVKPKVLTFSNDQIQ